MGVAVLLIVIGIYEVVTGQRITNVLEYSLRAPLDSLTRQDISQAVPGSESSNESVSEAAPDTSCCKPTAVSTDSSANTTTQNDTTTAPAIDYTTVYWQDDFNNTASGWEPYFEIKGELPVYASVNQSKSQSESLETQDIYVATANATAWNGYNNGDYVFTLPGAPLAQSYGKGYGSSITQYLWDFNTTQPLPAYPYVVDISAETTVGTGAMIVVDFVGNVSKVSAGSGIVVMIPMQKEMGLSLIGQLNNHLQVLEFRNNRLWDLGCSSDDTAVYPSQLHAQLFVDQTRISLSIKGDNVETIITCDRAFAGDSTQTRFLGIGSHYWNLQVPVPYANVLRFHNVFVAQPDPTARNDSAMKIGKAATEIRDANCDPFGGSSANANISLDRFLTGSCFDTVVWVTDPNPLAKRVQWPAKTDISGNWQCGSQEPFATFNIRSEKDYAIITLAGFSYHLLATENDYPFVVAHHPWGENYNNNSWHAEAQIGEYVASPSRIWYGLKLNADGSLQTSWMNQPCQRVN